MADNLSDPRNVSYFSEIIHELSSEYKSRLQIIDENLQFISDNENLRCLVLFSELNIRDISPHRSVKKRDYSSWRSRVILRKARVI
jgi:hypothetical protein